MKLIKSSFEILEQEPGVEGIYKQVEKAGRTAYKSENYITEDSAEKFVNMIKSLNHGACLEHGTVYLAVPMETMLPIEANIWGKYYKNPYSKGFKICEINGERRVAITTNYRVLCEHNWLDDLQYLCEPTEYHEKRITVKFILPISISREFIRHRVFSFMEQSTRYCNYNADKFNNEVTFIIPYWANLQEARYQYWDNDWVDATDQNKIPNTILKHFEGDSTDIFLSQCESAEVNYKALINRGCKAQKAREILPLCTKSELVMTGTVEQWKGFFKLRCDKAAHPQARELAIPLKEEFIKRGLLHDN